MMKKTEIIMLQKKKYRSCKAETSESKFQKPEIQA